MNRTDLQKMARIRVREARVLLLNGCFEGAYYLLGYAVECALKSCIAKKTRKFDFPDRKIVSDSYTHDLEKLLNVSGLKAQHDQQMKSNPDFAVNWAIVKDWSEEKRYSAPITRSQAKDLYSAVTARRNGVLTWVKKSW